MATAAAAVQQAPWALPSTPTPPGDEPVGETMTTAQGSVWVAVCCQTRAVAVTLNNTAAVAPVAGRNAIFDRPQPSVEETFAAQVLCVSADRADCDQAIAAHKTGVSVAGAEYTVTEHVLGLAAAPSAPVAGPQLHPCIDCGGHQLPADISRCPTCQKAYWQSCGWNGEE